MKAKNKIKQIFSIIVTAMMMMSLFTVNAFAATFDSGKATGTLTINRVGATYTAYKVLDYTAGSGIYEYTANLNFAGFFGNASYGSYTVAGMKDLTSEEDRVAFAAQLTKYAKDNSITGTVFEGGATAKELNIGYYVVAQTASTTDNAYVPNKPVSVAIPATTDNVNYNYDVVVTPKDARPTVDKKIIDGGIETTNSIEAIGNVVTYQLTADVVKYEPNTVESSIEYYLADTLSKGLTFNAGSVKVYGVKAGSTDVELTAGFTTTTTPNPTVEGQATSIKFDFTYSAIKAYDSVKVVYTAKLNQYANIGGTANPNDVQLVYTNNPTSGEKHETEKIEVKTYTYGVAIKKVDAEDTSVILPGAKFGIYSDESCSNEVQEGTTGADGYVYFKGLDVGTYYVKELEAPTGYVLSTEVTKVEITANENGVATYKVNGTESTNTKDISVADPAQTIVLLDVQITNSKGFSLPTTGGAGTWMFTIGGLVLMAGAVVVFASSRKKAK